MRGVSMNIAVCDDEQDYRRFIMEHIKFYFNDKYIDFECSEYDSGESLLSSHKDFDIVFLDIEMNEMNGIQVTKEINKRSNKTIVFIVTAYHQYLDEAMDLNVFRYIDKPINSKRLYNGLDKAIEYIDNNEIKFRTRDEGIITIDKNDIVSVEVANKKVYVTTIGQKYLVREKMDYFKDNLTATYFVIPHNSYIVNLNYVINFKRNSLLMKSNEIISIAPKKQTEIKKKFMRFIGEGYGCISDNI